MPDKPAGQGPLQPKPDNKPDPLANVMLRAGRVRRRRGVPTRGRISAPDYAYRLQARSPIGRIIFWLLVFSAVAFFSSGPDVISWAKRLLGW
jgi:hypothetical protein